ncbi:hypothetical protein AVEN_152052-1, partial [Araneus ventricosus]
DVTERGQEEKELESSIRITSSHSLKEPSPYEELARVTTAAVTKLTALLHKSRVSSDNRKLVQELQTLASVLFDKVEENGSLKAQVEMLQAENAALQAQLAAPRQQSPPALIPEQAQQTKVEGNFLRRSEESLIREVDLSKAKLGIKNIRKISRGGIAIECRSNKDLGKLLDEINSNAKISTSLEARVPSKKLPRVILYDVEKTVIKEQLLTKLVAQNDLNEKALKVLFSINSRSHNKCHWVLEAQPSEFKKILKTGKLSFEWSRLSLREFVRPTRCYKCNAYGHISTKCEGKETCPRCGEEGHKSQECENEKRCSACTAANEKHKKGWDTRHAATDSDCPTYWHGLAELKKRIFYGP